MRKFHHPTMGNILVSYYFCLCNDKFLTKRGEQFIVNQLQVHPKYLADLKFRFLFSLWTFQYSSSSARNAHRNSIISDAILYACRHVMFYLCILTCDDYM